MFWDETVSEKWRDRAIKNSDDLLPGHRYYNDEKGFFVFQRLASNDESYRELDMSYNHPDGEKLAWMIVLENDGHQRMRSLADCGINLGDWYYNPWFVFANEDDASRYYAELMPTVSFEDSNYYDILD